MLASTIASTACDPAPEAKSTTDTKAVESKSPTDTKPVETKSITDTKTAEAKPSDETVAAAGYAAPASPCGIADLSLLGPDAGTPNDGSVETEGIDKKISGCTYDLTGETINTFKLLVAVGPDAEPRFALFEQAWDLGITGFVVEPVTGLGSKAIYALRLTADDQRIEGTLALLDKDLYLEARFMGGGTKPWDGTDMRERLTKILRAAMTKLAQR